MQQNEVQPYRVQKSVFNKKHNISDFLLFIINYLYFFKYYVLHSTLLYHTFAE